MSREKNVWNKTDSTSWRYAETSDHSSIEYRSRTADQHVLIGPKRSRVHNRLDAVQRLVSLIYLRGAVTMEKRNLQETTVWPKGEAQSMESTSP